MEKKIDHSYTSREEEEGEERGVHNKGVSII